MIKIKSYKNIFIVVFAFLIALPFIEQSYYIDDYIYLDAAIKYDRVGLDSFKETSVQDGYIIPNYYFTHPLVWPWFLLLFIKVFSTTNEVALHLFSLINLIVLGLSALLLSKKFSKEPFKATILFIAVPAVVLMSHVIMTDIPTVAFFLLAIGLHIEGIEKKSKIYLWLAGIAVTISCGISYQALFLIFLISFYNFQKKENKFISYISVLIPTFFFVIWCLYTWMEFGIPHPFVSLQWGYLTDRNLFSDFFSKLLGNINAIGATTIFPLFILIAYSFKSEFRKLLIGSFIISILVSIFFLSEYHAIQKLLFVTYFTAGFFILLRFIQLFVSSLRKKDKLNIFLSVWFLTYFVVVVILMPLGIARYLLPIFFPLVIIVLNDWRTFPIYKKYKFAFSFVFLSTILWSFLCSIADYTFAGVYKDFSERIAAKYENSDVWYCGDALNWYMGEKGYKPLIWGENKPAIGDIIVLTSELWPYSVPEVMERTQLIDRVIYNSVLPIRTMNLSAHAGFYDHSDNALLPFSITRARYEEFSVYKIVK